jgi:hypothetical protein
MWGRERRLRVCDDGVRQTSECWACVWCFCVTARIRWSSRAFCHIVFHTERVVQSHLATHDVDSGAVGLDPILDVRINDQRPCLLREWKTT